jgi:hypothetical protein
MPVLLILLLAAVPVLAQSPTVQMNNTSRPASKDFQIGDRFEIVITATPNQPVSVRTNRQSRTDWGPVIGWTDGNGRWSTVGQFEKSDFGDWRETWTVGGKLASPIVSVFVGPPCVEGGQRFMGQSGPNMFISCETVVGHESFVTPSDPDPFRTPDGRMIPGRERSSMTADQYQAEMMQYFMSSASKDARPRELGDAAGALIAKIIGVNALSQDEVRNVLSIVHAAFEKPDRIPEEAKDPFNTVLLLLNLASSAAQPSLKQQIAETLAFIQAQ